MLMISFALLMITLAFLVLRSPTPKELKGKQIKEGDPPYCVTTNRLYLSGLSDYCVDSHYLYVLFGEKGIIKVYSIDGDYIKTFAVHHFPKGESSLRIEKESCKVFYVDENLNYYVFYNGEFVNYIKHHGYSEYVKDLENRFVSQEEQRRRESQVFYRKMASIVREDSDGTCTEVVHRPFYMLFFQGPIAFIVIACLTGICIVLKVLFDRIGKN